jgi:hypothetical protein
MDAGDAKVPSPSQPLGLILNGANVRLNGQSLLKITHFEYQSISYSKIFKPRVLHQSSWWCLEPRRGDLCLTASLEAGVVRPGTGPAKRRSTVCSTIIRVKQM